MTQDPSLLTKDAREAWKSAPIADLISHIVSHYHLETRVEMARLESHCEAAVLLHGPDQPALVEIRDQVTRLVTEMRIHLSFEEREAFPTMLAVAEGSAPASAGAGLAPLKALLMEEHETEAGLVRRLRGLTEAFTPSSAGAALHADLHSALRALAENLQQHLFLENQILFQRVL